MHSYLVTNLELREKYLKPEEKKAGKKTSESEEAISVT
jgi:hypothetical protein